MFKKIQTSTCPDNVGDYYFCENYIHFDQQNKCPPGHGECYAWMCSTLHSTYSSCGFYEDNTDSNEDFCRKTVCPALGCRHHTTTDTGEYNEYNGDFNIMGGNSRYTWVAIAAAATVAIIVTAVVVFAVARKLRRESSTPEENMEITA